MIRAPRTRAHLFAVAVAAALALSSIAMAIAGAWTAAALNMALAVFMVGSLSLQDLAYRQGYLRARALMYSSLQDAMQRGLTFGEWIQAEAERDAANGT